MTIDDGWSQYDRGCELFRARKFAESASSFEASAAVLTNERDPWYNLGIACLHEGDRIGGLHVETDGLRVVSPNDRWYIRAIEALTRALEIEPTYTPALVMRGHARRNRLDTDLARADWTAAQRMGDPHAAKLLAQLNG
jgi:tetratricopeptide (TPR) repeat protein